MFEKIIYKFITWDKTAQKKSFMILERKEEEENINLKKIKRDEKLINTS